MAGLGAVGALKSRDLPFCKTKIKKKKYSQLKARSTPSKTVPTPSKTAPHTVKGRPPVVIAGLTRNLPTYRAANG